MVSMPRHAKPWQFCFYLSGLGFIVFVWAILSACTLHVVWVFKWYIKLD